MSSIIITIDGPSGAGKGITAKLLAKQLHYHYLDTGAMYRAIGYYVKEHSIPIQELSSKMLNTITLSFTLENHIKLNGKDIEQYIRNEEIGKIASEISKIKEVREFLVKEQQNIIKQGGYIVDGRDAGTVIAPHASLKIFLTASPEVRAERRLQQLKEQGILEHYETVLQAIKERDLEDRYREHSPLLKAKDAIEIDNSNLTIEEQVDFIYNLAQKVIKEN
jgi:cytidylate kinase